LRHIDPEAYFSITNKLKNTKKERERYIEKFTKPIRNILNEKEYEYDIKGRPKSVNSIYTKIKNKGIDIDEIFDLFAIRIILKNIPLEKEKEECWNVYSLATNIYQPNPMRLRDWISTPRPSGYESLHTTVMGPDNHWVEVQIRTDKMDEIAEKGDAAHWKYKESKTKSDHDNWLRNIRDILESKDSTSIDEFHNKNKKSLVSNIFVFTPQGDIKKLRENATVLDFAYAIHSNIGNTCTGARVNEKIESIKYKLKNGDTVEIITSKNQYPREEWVNIVASPRTKIRIKKAINEKLFTQAKIGKEMLERKISQLKIELNDSLTIALVNHFKYKNTLILYQDIADNKIDLQTVKEFIININNSTDTHQTKDVSATEFVHSSENNDTKTQKASKDYLVIDKDLKNVDYKLAKCCHPIPGDDIFGFVTIDRGIIIHRKDCPNAKDLTKRYSYRIVPAKWTDKSKKSAFSVKISVTGLDKIGIVNNISEVISKDNNVDIRSMAINTKDGIFQGFITIHIRNLNHLDTLLSNINKIKGVLKAER
jgi:GTP pyrophosphokinase